ncbi:MAG: hypothetical protein JWP37_2417 [Mucilaginibacter sp.]|nr:hypothetical protein [Mucilaginibacter sp.]
MHILRTLLVFASYTFLIMPCVSARDNRQNNSRFIIHYVLNVDTADLSGYDVEIYLHHAPHHFHDLVIYYHIELPDQRRRFAHRPLLSSGVN